MIRAFDPALKPAIPASQCGEHPLEHVYRKLVSPECQAAISAGAEPEVERLLLQREDGRVRWGYGEGPNDHCGEDVDEVKQYLLCATHPPADTDMLRQQFHLPPNLRPRLMEMRGACLAGLLRTGDSEAVRVVTDELRPWQIHLLESALRHVGDDARARFAPLLLRANREHSWGRDRLHRALCQATTNADVQGACAEAGPDMEPAWTLHSPCRGLSSFLDRVGFQVQIKPPTLWSGFSDFKAVQATDEIDAAITPTCREAAASGGAMDVVGRLLEFSDALDGESWRTVTSFAVHALCSLRAPAADAFIDRALHDEDKSGRLFAACVAAGLASRDEKVRHLAERFVRDDLRPSHLFVWRENHETITPLLESASFRERLGPTLRRMNAHQSQNRDRLYASLCSIPVAAGSELEGACNELGPNQEPGWRAIRVEQERLSHAAARRNDVGWRVGATLGSLVLAGGQVGLGWAIREQNGIRILATTSAALGGAVLALDVLMLITKGDLKLTLLYSPLFFCVGAIFGGVAGYFLSLASPTAGFVTNSVAVSIPLASAIGFSWAWGWR